MVKETFKSASRNVNSNIVLVILVGAFSVQILSGIMTYISLIGLIAAFIIEIIIYGRIIAEIKGQESPSSLSILKDNWINYIVVTVLLVTPVLLFKQLEHLLPISSVYTLLVREGLSALILMATIYVFPIVFLKQEHVIAVFAGISYLIRNLIGSLPIILLVACVFVLKVSTIFMVLSVYKHTENLTFAIPFGVVSSIIGTYLAFLIFSAASTVLVQTKPNGILNGA